MKIQSPFSFALLSTLLVLYAEAKTIDPYKERNFGFLEWRKTRVNERFRNLSTSMFYCEILTYYEIFKYIPWCSRLSLQYHPDKNISKGAQQKIAEINNAYDILSDEQKRTNYDIYGDEKGAPGFDAGHPGDHGGYTYFTSGGPGQSGFTSGPDFLIFLCGSGGSRSFGSHGGSSSFGSDLDDIFSGFFGGGMKDQGGQFGGFSGSSKSQSQSRSSPKSIRAINSEVFREEIADQGITWLLLSYTPSLQGKQYFESIIEKVASLLQGAIKVGSINCETESSFCKDLGMHPRRLPRSVTEVSKRISLNHFDLSSSTVEKYPRVMLLSAKKDTPVIWRVLSGLYHKSIIFYDAEVHNVSDPAVKKLGVDALPVIIGWLSNGEKHILKSGISVKDLKSAIKDLSILLDSFEKKNKKVALSQTSKMQTDSTERHLPLLTVSNFDALCGDKTPVCVIGAFRSSRAREELEYLLSKVSQKSLSRRQTVASGSRDSISYILLDATKQPSFLSAFDKSGFKSSDNFLVAYKARKVKFAAFTGDMAMEEVEKFISSVLNGDTIYQDKPEACSQVKQSMVMNTGSGF
ncbi:hypothetical protein CRYUN_Cryun08bG0168700 [Craigia yunnanensis]